MQTTGPAIWGIGYLLVDALMRSGPVVIGLILLECPLELRLSRDIENGLCIRVVGFRQKNRSRVPQQTR
jgi:hypothetical protein